MAQRIFDIDNPQDVKDLFDILPDNVSTIEHRFGVTNLYEQNSKYIGSCYYISINWRNKTEISRPVDESEWIGCLCWFADDADNKYIGVLHAIRNGDDSYPYVCQNGILRSFKNCRPVRRDEVKFVEDVE